MDKKPWEQKGWIRNESIGQGGHGKVFLVKNKSDSNKLGALKQLIKKDDPERRLRLIQEITALEKLRHPRIPQIFDHNIKESELHAEEFYMVTKFIEGKTLNNYFEGSASIADAVNIVQDLLNTLEYCHRNNVIHRDIKPNNIIIDSAGTSYLIDFGLSFELEENDDDGVTGNSQALGNSFLHLPELHNADLLPDQRRDSRSDLCSLAAILFYLVTKIEPKGLEDHNRQKPHERRRASDILENQVNDPELLQRLRGFFDKAFQVKPEDRFQSAGELSAALFFLRANEISGLSYSKTIQKNLNLLGDSASSIKLIFKISSVFKGPDVYRVDFLLFGKNESASPINTYSIDLSLPKAFVKGNLVGENKIASPRGEYRYVDIPAEGQLPSALIPGKEIELYQFALHITPSQCNNPNGANSALVAQIFRKGQLLDEQLLSFEELGLYEAIDKSF